MSDETNVPSRLACAALVTGTSASSRRRPVASAARLTSESSLEPSSPKSDPPPDWEKPTLGVAFFDLSRMAEWASSEEDERVASFLQGFYELASERLTPAGCRIVKPF